MTAYITLEDYAEKEKLMVAGVANILREASPLMDSLSFYTSNSQSLSNYRRTAMPTIGWRRKGESHGSSKGHYAKVEDVPFSFGNTFDADKMDVKDQNVMIDALTANIAMTTESMALSFNDAFINGSPVSDADMLVGLHYRLQNGLASAQTLDSSLDVSVDSSTTNFTGLYFDWLNQLLGRMPGGKADLLIMNDSMKRRHDAMCKLSGLLDTTKDALERTFSVYNGAKIVDAGYTAALSADIIQTTRVITNSELATALTGGGETSIYAVRLGAQYLQAFQEYPMDVSEPFLLENRVTTRVVMDWTCGLLQTHPMSVGRLCGLTAA
jgi:hypothetical protein